MRPLLPLAFCLVSSACVNPDALLAGNHAALVYGEDDRQEVYDADEALRLAARAVAAVIPRGYVHSADGQTRITAPRLAEAEQVCADESFSEQPSAAECTAVLIDDNLLLTAGHCFANAWDCRNYVFAFGYAYDDESQPGQLAPLELYECRRTRVHEADRPGTTFVRDYAIVELERRVSGREPVSIRAAAPALGERVATVSTTQGTPLKLDLGGRVVGARSPGDYFLLDADTFHGSSGAPVFDADNLLLGVLARGTADYELDASAGCYRAARRDVPGIGTHGPESSAYAENASRVTPAVHALCAAGYPSTRLCQIEPRCGDLICSPDESSETCGGDCQTGLAAVSPATPAPAASVQSVAASTPPLEAGEAGCQVGQRHRAGWTCWLWVVLAWSWRRLRVTSNPELDNQLLRTLV